MMQSEALQLTYQALWLVLLLSAPPVIVAAIIGLVIAFLQAATQIQEQTLSFAVKLIAVMATLAELTARSVAVALRQHLPAAHSLHVCGGGAFNANLMARLQRALPDMPVDSTAALGVPPDQVEAMAFAWLAQAFMVRRPGNLPAVTGAAGPRVLGALYPAG